MTVDTLMMSVSNGGMDEDRFGKVEDGLEMDNVQDKRTRFQVNRVKSEGAEKNSHSDVLLSLADETEDTDEENLIPATDRTRLNSETVETKNLKSFR